MISQDTTNTAVERSSDHGEAPGLAARRFATELIDEVLRAGTALDETFERLLPKTGLDAADAGLARAIATVSFRRLGSIRAAIDARLERGSPRKSGPFEPVMVAAAAQILFLDVPDHAAVDLAIRLLHEDARSARYASLGNAVLRRLARERDAILAGLDPMADVPEWLAESWSRHYGRDTALAIARACRDEPPLDRSQRQERCGGLGGQAWRRPPAHRLGAAARTRHRLAAGRLRRGRMVGAGRGRRAARETAWCPPG